MENEFARNREHIDRIAKYKFDGDKVLFSGCLVSQDGRFRVPGSKYTSIKTLKPNSRRSKIDGEDSRLSVCSSQRSVRSRQSSQLSNRKPVTQSGLRVSSRSASKQKLRTSGADFFEQKRVPELSLRNTTKSKGFMVKKGPTASSYKTRPLGGKRENPVENSDMAAISRFKDKKSKEKEKSLSKTINEF